MKGRIVLGVLLAAAVVTAARADEADDARKAVTGLAKDLEAGKDIARKAASAAKDHDLDLVMAAFKPRDRFGRGGLGAGKLGDGLEKALDKLSRKGVAPGDFAALKNDLAQLARVSQAIAEMTEHYGAARAKAPAKLKLWQKSTEEMKKASAALRKAVEAGEAAKVKGLAAGLAASCAACHGEFRPN